MPHNLCIDLVGFVVKLVCLSPFHQVLIYNALGFDFCLMMEPLLWILISPCLGVSLHRFIASLSIYYITKIIFKQCRFDLNNSLQLGHISEMKLHAFDKLSHHRWVIVSEIVQSFRVLFFGESLISY